MNVPRRILYSLAVAIVAVTAAIHYLPDYNFVQHVVPLLGLGLASTLILTSISFYRQGDLTMHDKNLLMNGFLVAIMVPTLYTAGAFMHESKTSWSGGEIHYHADYEVFAEDESGELERLNLIDPSNFCENDYMCTVNDRTGSTKYHEHNDNRIHLEGIFKEREDATLAAYFETFDGKLTNRELVYPTNDGVVEKTEGDGKTLKILVNRGVGGGRHWCVIGSAQDESDICKDPYTSELATSPENYIVSPHKRGPSLDDIFIVYDSKTVEAALKDVRQDNNYRDMGLQKSGEGF